MVWPAYITNGLIDSSLSPPQYTLLINKIITTIITFNNNDNNNNISITITKNEKEAKQNKKTKKTWGKTAAKSYKVNLL